MALIRVSIMPLITAQIQLFQAKHYMFPVSGTKHDYGNPFHTVLMALLPRRYHKEIQHEEKKIQIPYSSILKIMQQD